MIALEATREALVDLDYDIDRLEDLIDENHRNIDRNHEDIRDNDDAIERPVSLLVCMPIACNICVTPLPMVVGSPSGMSRQ